MRKLLQEGIKAVRALPAHQQDMAGELLLWLATTDSRYQLMPAQLEDLRRSLAAADRGEFASDEEVAEAWKKFNR